MVGIADGKGPLECRIRFKVPDLQQLWSLDKKAFHYYFQQVKRDFCGSQVMTPGSALEPTDARDFVKSPVKWFVPSVISADMGALKRKHIVFNLCMNLMAYLVAIESLEGDGDPKKVSSRKTLASYLPKDLLSDYWLEKPIGKRSKTFFGPSEGRPLILAHFFQP